MGTRILCRAIQLYWAFMPDEPFIDHVVIGSWQWKFCWDIAAHIEEQS